MTPTFTIKIYRGGSSNPSSVEFYASIAPRVMDLKNPTDDVQMDDHQAALGKGATHAIDIVVNDRIDTLYLFGKDVMFMESPQGNTIYSINRRS